MRVGCYIKGPWTEQIFHFSCKSFPKNSRTYMTDWKFGDSACFSFFALLLSTYMVFISWIQHRCSSSNHYICIPTAERERIKEKGNIFFFKGKSQILQRQLFLASLSPEISVFISGMLKLQIVGDSKHLVDIFLPNRYHNEINPQLEILILAMLLTSFEIPARSFNFYDSVSLSEKWEKGNLMGYFKFPKSRAL